MKAIQIALLLSNIGLIVAETETYSISWAPHGSGEETQWKALYPHNTPLPGNQPENFPDEMEKIFNDQNEERTAQNGNTGIHAVFLGLKLDEVDKLMEGLLALPEPIIPALMTYTGMVKPIVPGRVYYQFAPYDKPQMEALDVLYHDTKEQQKGIILFGDADKDKERTAGPRKYGSGQAQPIKDFGEHKSYLMQPDRTFAFGITTTWKKEYLSEEAYHQKKAEYKITNPGEEFNNNLTAEKWSGGHIEKYEELMAEQFKKLWENYVSRGYDVVVPIWIKFGKDTDGKFKPLKDKDGNFIPKYLKEGELLTSIGKGAGNLPDKYHDVITKHLLLLEKQTGKESIYLPGAPAPRPTPKECPWGRQYGLTEEQRMAGLPMAELAAALELPASSSP